MPGASLVGSQRDVSRISRGVTQGGTYGSLGPVLVLVGRHRWFRFAVRPCLHMGFTISEEWILPLLAGT